MTIAEFQAKLTAVINVEPDPDVPIAQFWHEFLRHYDIMAAAPDTAGVITLRISAASGRDIERITYPWATIEADFLDVDASVWENLANSRKLRRMLGHGDWGPPPQQ